ncbi:MAG: DUF3822 family protein [Flavobacteriaceae bacterium]|nr:DUF3822 family protein [Flavobacteriaceae bacterium]
METGQKITEQTTNIDELSSHILSIQVSLNGLSFCMLESDSNTIIYFRSESFQKKLNPQELLERLDMIINEDSELSKSIQSVKVIYANELSVLVPNSLFNEEHLADYLKFNTRILQTDFLAFDAIPSNDSMCVYVPYVNINNYLYEKFGAFNYMHASSILIETILNLEKNAEEQKMYVHVGIKYFEIVVVDNNSLILYNTFEFKTKEDFIYYILFTAEQLQLNPETIQLALLGHISEADELFEIAFKYIRHVQLIEPTIKFEIDPSISKEISNLFILLNSF